VKAASRRVLILADESANWEVAGLRQLDRLALSINEAARQLHPHERTSVFVRWNPEITAEKRWLPKDERLDSIEFATADEGFESADLILSSRLVPFRNALRLGNGDPGCQLDSEKDIPACEKRLLRRGGKSQDGLVSRFLNRPISRTITRVLLKTAITPSGWTWLIVPIVLIGSFLLLRGEFAATVWGLILFHVYSVLDGCDGEIARAKFLESVAGRRLDGLCDIASNLLLALCLGLGLAGTYAIEGFVTAGLIAANEWFLAARHSKKETKPEISTDSPFYPRHRDLLQHSGIGMLGEKFTYWLVQLTKRDVAMLAFVVLALLNRPVWILHLLGVTAAVSLTLAVKAGLTTNR